MKGIISKPFKVLAKYISVVIVVFLIWFLGLLAFPNTLVHFLDGLDGVRHSLRNMMSTPYGKMAVDAVVTNSALMAIFFTLAARLLVEGIAFGFPKLFKIFHRG